MKKLLGYLITLTLLCTLVVGCTPPLAKPEGVQVIDFRLGESSVMENGVTVPYPLDGLMGIPEGNDNPVVFILHGAHPVEDITESRYYNGFKYLVRHLAENGYLAAAININRAFSFEPVEGSEVERAYHIFKDYYVLLEQANEGKKVFAYDLTQKANLEKINFIGHSRGGDNSLAIAKALNEQNSSAVQSVLLVAPPINSPLEQSYTDVPTGIILPQYDGDVYTLSGADVFNYVYHFDDKRRTPITSAFLYGGDHSQFNTELTGRDQMFSYENVTYITASEQQDFLKQYATDFLNQFNTENMNLIETLGHSAPSRYAVDFMPSVYLPSRKVLVTPSKMSPIFKETSENLFVEYVELSGFFKENTVAPFKTPYTLDEKAPLYRVSWKNNALELTLPIETTDFTDSNYLSLYMANDSTSPLNDGSVPVAFEVELTDIKGNSASYKLDALKDSALRYIPTTVSNIFEGIDGLTPYFEAEYYTPLSTQIIPLSTFSEIDLSHIESITLKGISTAGSIMLGGIDLY